VRSEFPAVKTPVIVPLTSPDALLGGGKAKGLHLLLRAGARVPEGFVVRDPQAPDMEEELRVRLEGRFDLGTTAFAVRSSGLEEDGTQASFAGQYQTILDVRGLDGILSAVRSCVQSAASQRVRQYAARRALAARESIPVVIQRMIDARCAGVVFTADPVTHRRDRLVINAVRGLGEKLVGGQSTGEMHTLSRRGQELAFASEYPGRLLSGGQVDTLRTESLRIQGLSGHPVDLEWAMDARGEIWWLQLRPITTLSPVHINELDCAPPHPEAHLLTRCNVGEMMPGPVTPLTWSVFARGIDVGMQDFLVRLRVQDRIREENRFIFMFYNHLFIDMTPLYGIPRKVAFTTKADVDNSICGRIVDGPQITPTRPPLVRLRNLACYVGYFMSASRRLRKLRRLVNTFTLPSSRDPREMHAAIDAALPRVHEAWAHHYATSGKSGALNGALLRILESDGSGTMQEHLGALAGLLTGLGGINGALALEELGAVKNAILADPVLRGAFRGESAARCLGLLRSARSGEAGRLFRVFLRRHGHRCVREAELREKDWESEPEALVRTLQKNVASNGAAAGSACPAVPRSGSADPLSRYCGRTRFIVRRVLPSVRRFVVARENSKSLCIRLQHTFKKAYLHLGRLLTEQGLLDDADQLFFLTHQEIGKLISNPGPWGRQTAGARRELHPSLFHLQFEDFSQGIPEPAEKPVPQARSEGVLVGVPVSGGIVTAKARVINTLTDAEELAPGEIMIASCTDVGWTPYFSTISGLITEIGSTLSHGAVVAREYGIPAIVGVRGVRSRVRTGDTLTIDGRRGTVELHRGLRR
jgi:rifampicin phosphotransferase